MTQKFDVMPDGWKYDSTWGSPLAGYAPICDGVSRLCGGKKGLLRVNDATPESVVSTPQTSRAMPSRQPAEPQDMRALAMAQNQLAREQTKRRLLADLLMDLQVCRIEGLEPDEYVCDLKSLIDDAFRRIMRREPERLRQGVLF